VVPWLSRRAPHSSGSAAQDECSAFAAHINAFVHDERRLPLDPSGADLFDKLSDGVLLWCARCVCVGVHGSLVRALTTSWLFPPRAHSKLVNAVLPGTVDERVINDKPGDTSRFLRSENIQLALASARGIGCRRVRLRCKGGHLGTEATSIACACCFTFDTAARAHLSLLHPHQARQHWRG
jgi:hypothetical protein